MSTVRTRFAPSPTGYMHIGGMRTALFNWLWARHHGGKFILRIDDTDQERNVEEALGPILNAFRWLGLDWDEGPEVGGDYGPYFQSQRNDFYTKAVEKLLAEGKAYRCYDPPEVIKADREEADKAKRPYINIRRSIDLSEEEIKAHEEAGTNYVIRLLVPRDEKIEIEDAVRGHVEWDCGLITDPVIMRTNGTPLYNFATVIDDAEMKISHVVRAEEHLSNTPVQVLVYQALGYDLPVFAHIPYVAAPASKEKLSKRKLEKYRKNPKFKKMFDKADQVFPLLGLEGTEGLDPVMVEYYEKVGYLPVAVLNALSRLGWSLDDKTEIMSLETVTENFTLDRVVKNAAGLDPDKLYSFQSHWMNELSAEEKLEGCLPYLVKAGVVNDPPVDEEKELLSNILEALGDRLKLFSDILDSKLFFENDVTYDEKAFKKRVAKKGVPELLKEFRGKLETVEEWSVENLENELKAFSEAKEKSPGLLIHSLRVCTTGQPVGPGVYDCLVLIGKEKSLERIDQALDQVPAE